MPDAGLTDGLSELTSAFFETYIRKQLVAQLTTASLPAAATEGRLFADTTINGFVADTGAALVTAGLWGAWTAYTPTISAATTPPTGWTTAGNYWRFGNLIVCYASFTYGAGTAAVGQLRFGLPVTAKTGGFSLGGLAANNSGTPYYRWATLGSTTYAVGYTEAGVALTGASPFTPGASDFYNLFMVYEAA